MSADQLWEIVEDGKQKAGSTGVDGIVRLGRQALPSLSRNKLAKLAALLVVETEQFSTSGQVNSWRFYCTHAHLRITTNAEWTHASLMGRNAPQDASTATCELHVDIAAMVGTCCRLTGASFWTKCSGGST